MHLQAVEAEASLDHSNLAVEAYEMAIELDLVNYLLAVLQLPSMGPDFVQILKIGCDCWIH